MSSRGLWWKDHTYRMPEEDPVWWRTTSMRSRFVSTSGDSVQHEHSAAFPEQSRTFSKDWLHCLRTWPKSFVLRRIRQPLIWIVVWSAFIAGWAQCHPISATKTGVMSCGTGLHTLVGGALSLLLVFRTNTAYHRYWEGRQIFDKLSTRARDVADFFALFATEINHARVQRLAALLRAFPIALQLHLQGFSYQRANLGFSAVGKDTTHTSVGEREVRRLFQRLGGDPSGTGEIPHQVFLKQLRSNRNLGSALGVPTDLDEAQALNQLYWLKFDRKQRLPLDKGITLDELAKYYQPLQLFETLAHAGKENRHAIACSTNMPLAIASMISREIKAVPFNEETFTSRERMWVLSNIAHLRSTISAAERIVQTPVPLHYARHTSRFLSVWCLTLPLCLVHQIPPFFLPFVVALISWSLLGLREIGLLIENPFRRSLQLTMVTDTIGSDIDDTFTLHYTFGPAASLEDDNKNQHHIPSSHPTPTPPVQVPPPPVQQSQPTQGIYHYYQSHQERPVVSQ